MRHSRNHFIIFATTHLWRALLENACHVAIEKKDPPAARESTMRALLSLVGAATAVMATLPGSSSLSDVRGISPALQLKLASVSTVRTLARAHLCLNDSARGRSLLRSVCGEKFMPVVLAACTSYPGWPRAVRVRQRREALRRVAYQRQLLRLRGRQRRAGHVGVLAHGRGLPLRERGLLLAGRAHVARERPDLRCVCMCWRCLSIC